MPTGTDSTRGTQPELGGTGVGDPPGFRRGAQRWQVRETDPIRGLGPAVKLLKPEGDVGAPRSCARPSPCPPFPNARNIKAFLFRARWWIFLPGFRPCCFPRGLSEGRLPLETARINHREEQSPTRVCTAKPRVFIHGYIQDFALTPWLTCSVTPGAPYPMEKSQFLVKIPGPKTSGRGQRCLSPCLVSLAGDTTKAWSVGCFHPALHIWQIPTISRSRRQNSCNPFPNNN